MLKSGVNEIDNAGYHADRQWLSSSAFKLLIKNHNEFNEKYILNNWPKQDYVPALAFGTAAHTLILEPHLFNESVIVYPGQSRRGNEWKNFLQANENKTILTIPENDKLQILNSAYQNDTNAIKLLDNCLFEHTMCAELQGIKVKARADAINLEAGYIVDLKTTAYPAEKEAFSMVSVDLYYDLSAALYCLVAEQIYGKKFDFYFIVLSKSDLRCKTYKASQKFMQQGIDKLMYSFEKYKHFLLNNNYDYDMIEEEVENGIEEI